VFKTWLIAGLYMLAETVAEWSKVRLEHFIESLSEPQVPESPGLPSFGEQDVAEDLPRQERGA